MSCYRNGPIELRLGDYREVLADVEPDAVITDPPYSERTHTGLVMTGSGGVHGRGPVSYASWGEHDVAEFATRFSGVDGWIAVLTDDVLAPALTGAMRARYAFAHLPAERRVIKGGKPMWLMRSLTRDYSRPADLVCDPCAGAATTLIAAALEGRRAIGAELDPETFELACKRIERTALTRPLPGLEATPMDGEQGNLL